ncbi:MAG TPA: ATP-binding cassette domain-containing protein [Oligoflexus sp.]|uniref:ATP-binding cassette domain-containing protein n=1 Tax=Oligoflexus sp. TaxID=1971216 RepID=UPI002D5D800E|nr:ATP-binding cassette domain-containing protein [Oligoflexus sp.]HYX36659.1 ATP-binding cassette domain-containing protein [Oligoflexus sp.]
MKEQGTLIDIHSLSYRYGRDAAAFLALKNISLQIKQGEFVAITGASGSGKSTLMNLLGTLATAQDGVFAIEGENTAHLHPDALASLRNRTIGFVFQQFHLLPRLTILENVMLPLNYMQPRPDADERARYQQRAMELLGRLGIQDQALKLPTNLSGGQKQRAAIARSLLLDPAVILADEPTGALDSHSSSEVMKIFAQLHAEGRTVILITHDPEVTRAAKRRIELKDGTVVGDHEQPGLTAETTSLPKPSTTELPKPGWLSNWQSLAPLRQAWQALVSSKLRTALTCLGLIIGVTSITTMLTLGSAAQDVILKIFDRSGADRIYIGLDYQASRTNSNGYWQGLHIDQDLPSMQATFAAYGRISMLWGDFNQNAVVGGVSTEVKIDSMGNHHDFIDQGLKITKGRMFAPHEMESAGAVALVGSDFAQSMFPKQYPGRYTNPQFPIGEVISLRGRLQTAVTIIGVMGKRDTTFSEKDINARMFVPLSLLMHYTTEKRSTWISVVPKPGVSHRWLADSVVHYLKLKTAMKYPFRAEVPEETIGQIMLFITIFQALTTLIGGLCILVGGIGIMNIMLVTIAERIKEIGLRKALGATGHDIVRQFLVECMLLCVVSGVVGTVIGAVFCNVVALVGHAALPEVIPRQLLLNPLGLILGLGTAVFCGMTFGMMPALRASKLDPSEALRSE